MGNTVDIEAKLCSVGERCGDAWQVEFYKNGAPTRFRLIAEPDIEMIREKLGLSESAFTYIDFETYEEVKENNEEKK